MKLSRFNFEKTLSLQFASLFSRRRDARRQMQSDDTELHRPLLADW